MDWRHIQYVYSFKCKYSSNFYKNKENRNFKTWFAKNKSNPVNSGAEIYVLKKQIR